MDIVLNGLGQYWKEIEEYRLSQYLIKRQTLSDAIPVPILTPKLEEDDEGTPQLRQKDNLTDRKQKSIVINTSIDVKFHQYKGDILYTQICIASLDDLLIEALIDTEKPLLKNWKKEGDSWQKEIDIINLYYKNLKRIKNNEIEKTLSLEEIKESLRKNLDEFTWGQQFCTVSFRRLIRPPRDEQ